MIRWFRWSTLPERGTHQKRYPTGDPRSENAGWLAGLLDVNEHVELVTPRGVALPYSAAWELEDVLGVLATVEAL